MATIEPKVTIKMIIAAAMPINSECRGGACSVTPDDLAAGLDRSSPCRRWASTRSTSFWAFAILMSLAGLSYWTLI